MGVSYINILQLIQTAIQNTTISKSIQYAFYSPIVFFSTAIEISYWYLNYVRHAAAKDYKRNSVTNCETQNVDFTMCRLCFYILWIQIFISHCYSLKLVLTQWSFQIFITTAGPRERAGFMPAPVKLNYKRKNVSLKKPSWNNRLDYVYSLL